MSIEKLSPLGVPFVSGSVIPIVEVDFTVVPTETTVFEIITFTSIITGGYPIVSVLWEFGDGLTSTELNPTHGYKLPGVYTVSLTVYISGGLSFNETKYYYITITEQVDSGLIDDFEDRASNLLIEEVKKQYGETRTSPAVPGDPDYIASVIPTNPDPIEVITDMENRAVNLLIENVRKQYGEG